MLGPKIQDAVTSSLRMSCELETQRLFVLPIRALCQRILTDWTLFCALYTVITFLQAHYSGGICYCESPALSMRRGRRAPYNMSKHSSKSKRTRTSAPPFYTNKLKECSHRCLAIVHIKHAHNNYYSFAGKPHWTGFAANDKLTWTARKQLARARSRTCFMHKFNTSRLGTQVSESRPSTWATGIDLMQ